MDDALRTRIRQLYFVEQIAPRTIAERLGLSLQAVRAALVLPGGMVLPQSPEPVSATVTPLPCHATQRHR